MIDAGRVGPPDQVNRALLRRWPWLLVGLILGLVVAGAYGLSRSSTYTADASVVVRPISQNAFGSTSTTPDRQLSMPNEVVIGRSQAVLDRASATLKNAISPADLRDNAKVSNPSNTSVLQFAYTSKSKSEAANVANVLAQSYLTERQAQARQVLSAQTSSLQGSQTTLQQQQQTLTRQLNNTPTASAERDALTTQLTEVSGALRDVQQQLATSNAVDTTPGQIVEPASTPGSKDGPALILLLIAGAVIGLILGFAAALVAVRLNTRLRHTYELASVEGAGVVMSLPREGSRSSAEAWRTLAARLHNRGVGETYGSVAITSPRGEANAAAATALVQALRELGIPAQHAGRPAAGDPYSNVLVSSVPMTAGAAALSTFGQASTAVVLVSRGTRWRRLHSLYGLLEEARVPVIATAIVKGAGGRDADSDAPLHQPMDGGDPRTQPSVGVPSGASTRVEA